MTLVQMKPFRKKGRTIAERFFDFAMPEPNSGCWLWLGPLYDSGYGSFNTGNGCVHAHRFSWELHNSKIPRELFACHKCDVRCCVNPEHVFIGTCQDNHDDMIRKGRKVSVIGSAHPKTRLTEQDVLNIRADTRPLDVIGAQYGFDKQHVWKIKKRWYWKHI